jgi:hypothetical protein
MNATAPVSSSPLFASARLCSLLRGDPAAAAVRDMAAFSVRWAQIEAMPESPLRDAARRQLEKRIKAFEDALVAWLLHPASRDE